MNKHKKARPYCDEALERNPNSLHGLLAKASRQLEADEFEACMQTLNHAKENVDGAAQNPRISEMLQKAHTLLKRLKEKDYYKVLGVSRDADEREIKRAYRKMTLQYHPDKVAQLGGSKEEAEKKMASINEAYEVLSNPELKQRFDMGDDPNNLEGRGSPFQGSPFGGGQGHQQFFFQQGGGPAGFKFPGGGGFQFQGQGFPGF
jgi:DnaJ homolog subfamily C member 3